LSAPEPRVLVVDRTGELAARIRHNVVGARAVVKACRDTARAGSYLAAGHWDVVVAGPSLMHRTGLRGLASLHQRHPWVSLVLALHERPRADLAEIIGVGADDLVPLHADDGDLQEALARAVRITRARLGLAAGGPGAASGRGRIVMISSASGGCGKTFLATNAAEFLARTTGQPVVLVDLDLQFGEVSTALRLRPDVTIIDALTAEAEGADLDEILDEYLLPHPDGFKVLAAPRQPAEADSVTPGDVTRILDVLRARRAWVVIDTHEGLSDLFVAALEATDHVFAVATPDRPSLVNLGRYLATIERLGMAAGNISVVLNKAEAEAWGLHQPPPRHTGLDAVGMAAELGRRFEAVVPYSRDVPRSINVGVPLLAGKPRSPISTLLTTALSAVLPGALKVEPVTPAPIPIPIRVPTAAPLPIPEPLPTHVPEPAPAPADSAATVAEEESPEDGPGEIDVSVPAPRPCRAAAPARRVGRCRRSPERPRGAPLGRGRGPPGGRGCPPETIHPTRPGH
jgi:pilus assembly protein CpaE